VAQQTLAELIANRRGGRSYKRLAEESPGGTPVASRWHQLENRPLRRDIPETPTIISIAAVLGVSPFTVVRASCASLGWDTGRQTSDLMDRLSAYDVGELDDDEVDAVVAVVVAMIRSAREHTTMASGG
jgi:hypothetical protein